MSNADSPVNTAGIQAPAWSVARWLAVNLRGNKVDAMVDNCAACHRVDGKAAGDVFPALPGNPTVLQEDPASLIRVILAGARLPSTHMAPSDLGMPGFAWRLSDEETAQLVTFVRNSWGNQAPPVGAADVAKVGKLVKEHEIHTADKGDTRH